MLRRFWFVFDPADIKGKYPGVLKFGAGVTAYDLTDAKQLLEHNLFKGPCPKLTNIIYDIDFDSLEENHVKRNIGVMAVRGIWFPDGLRNMNYPRV